MGKYTNYLLLTPVLGFKDYIGYYIIIRTVWKYQWPDKKITGEKNSSKYLVW